MRLFGRLRKFARVNKRKLLVIAVLFVGLVALNFLLAKFLTPYQNNLATSHTAFYSANNPQPDIMRAKVLEVSGGEVKVELMDGPRTGQTVEIQIATIVPAPGDEVLIPVDTAGNLSQNASTFWRLPGILTVFFGFVFLVFLVIGRRGLSSLAGLVISIAVIAFGLIPAIIGGANALLACIVAAVVIAGFSILVAHGFNRQSLVSLASIYIVLALAAGLAIIGGALGHLTGVYDEASALFSNSNNFVDMHGVLVGGIIIATLGVLDDVITTQTATVAELHKAQPKMSAFGLYQRAFSVGREHVTALVNTLALAYVGASLPVILAIVYSANSYVSPLLIFNTEFITQEIIRTLISSSALVMAVPISTLVAVVAVRRWGGNL